MLYKFYPKRIILTLFFISCGFPNSNSHLPKLGGNHGVYRKSSSDSTRGAIFLWKAFNIKGVIDVWSILEVLLGRKVWWWAPPWLSICLLEGGEVTCWTPSKALTQSYYILSSSLFPLAMNVVFAKATSP